MQLHQLLKCGLSIQSILDLKDVETLPKFVLESQQMKKRIIIVLLLTFLSVTTLINFFHTDHALRAKDNCPACHLQNSIPDFSPSDAYSTCRPPELVAFERPIEGKTGHCQQVFLEHPSSRAPPLV
jgi:hypothetical protein